MLTTTSTGTAPAESTDIQLTDLGVGKRARVVSVSAVDGTTPV